MATMGEHGQGTISELPDGRFRVAVTMADGRRVWRRARTRRAADEITIEDPAIENALELRQTKKEQLAAVRKIYDGADEEAAAAIAKLELPEGGAVRVGRFRITRQAIEARSVSFESKASSRVRISLVDEG